MKTLTPAQQWILTKGKVNKRSMGLDPIRLTIAANDIDGAFNCVDHYRLTQIMTHYLLSTDLVRTIQRFASECTVSLSFDRMAAPLTHFTTGLPRGSSLSLVLFMLYVSGLTRAHQTALQVETAYVDDEIMIQGARSPALAVARLQTRLDDKLAQATYLNIRLALAKSELMQLLPHTSKLKPNDTELGISSYGQDVSPSLSV